MIGSPGTNENFSLMTDTNNKYECELLELS